MPEYKTVNIPAELHEQLAQWCAENGHSIVWVLTQLITAKIEEVADAPDS